MHASLGSAVGLAIACMRVVFSFARLAGKPPIMHFSLKRTLRDELSLMDIAYGRDTPLIVHIT